MHYREKGGREREKRTDNRVRVTLSRFVSHQASSSSAPLNFPPIFYFDSEATRGFPLVACFEKNLFQFPNCFFLS